MSASKIFMEDEKTRAAICPSRSIPGSEISFSGGIYTPQMFDTRDRVLKDVKCKALESTSDGDIVLHLTDDVGTDGSERNVTITLLAGVPRYFLFDRIVESGTTVTTSNLILYPL